MVIYSKNKCEFRIAKHTFEMIDKVMEQIRKQKQEKYLFDTYYCIYNNLLLEVGVSSKNNNKYKNIPC